MNPVPQRAPFFNDAIIVDEVGIEVGVYGEYRLRSLYRPIFAREGEQLRPVAVEGLIGAFRAGNRVSSDEFLATVAADDRLFIDGMCRALHLRNFPNIGVERLKLHFSWDPAANSDHKAWLREIRLVGLRLVMIGLGPEMLVCEVTDTAAFQSNATIRLVEDLRSQGVRIAIDNFGPGHSTDIRLGLVRPDIVKIEGAWFRNLCREEAAIRLLRTVIAGVKARGAKVLVEGVEDASQLECGLQAGADLFTGDYLGLPALVGTAFDGAPLDISRKLAQSPNVAQLFG